ncbi:MAG: hypothetical protein WBC04_21175 [Candidatus Acidiferrales bacterium]
MKRSRLAFCAACLGLVIGVLIPSAHPQQQQTAPSLRAVRYDSATEVVTKGTIESLEQQKNPAGLNGTHLILRTVPLALDVHMGLFGPKDIPFHVGEQVQVTGSLVNLGGKQILLAREIRSASQVLTVRNALGIVKRPGNNSRGEGAQQ